MNNIEQLKIFISQSDTPCITNDGKPNVSSNIVMAGIVDLAGMMMTTIFFEEHGNMSEKGSEELRQILHLLANTRRLLGANEAWRDENLYLVCRIVADLCEEQRAYRANSTVPASIVADRICDDINNDDPCWEDYAEEYSDDEWNDDD
jgi:hypothetical protein